MESPAYFETPQYPTDVVNRGMDFTKSLASTNDSIVSVTVTEATNTLIITDVAFVGGQVSFFVTGGISNTDYIIATTLVLASEQTQTFEAYITIS